MHLTSATLQVAALQFGEFYDLQYAKMYSIFMIQLQVILLFLKIVSS